MSANTITLEIVCEIYLTEKYSIGTDLEKVLNSRFCRNILSVDNKKVFAIEHVGNARELLEESGRFITKAEFDEISKVFDFY